MTPEDVALPGRKERASSEIKRKRARSPRIQGYIDAFRQFKIGQSFFVEGVVTRDLNFVRKPFTDAGLGVVMREVEQDEIYGVAGVRVWRQPGPADQVGNPYEQLARAYEGVTFQSARTSQAEPDPATSEYDPDLDGPTSNNSDATDEDDEL